MTTELEKRVAQLECELNHREHSAKKNRTYFVAVLIVALLASTGICWLLLAPSDSSSRGEARDIPQHIRAAVSFPVFYPLQIPDGFTLINESFQISNDSLSFTFKDSRGKQLVITEQARPKDFDTDMLTIEETYKTSIGSGHIAEFNKRKTGVILTSETLLTISGIEIRADDIKEFTKSF